MTGKKETVRSDYSNLNCHDSKVSVPFTCQDGSYEIRAAISTIEDRTAFLHTLRTIAETCDTHIICFNADMLAGMCHAHTAMFHSVRSFNKGTMVSKTLEMEALLYAAGSRQCSLAAQFGVHAGKNNLYVCCYPTSEKVWDALSSVICIVEDSLSSIDSEKKIYLMDLFGITQDELATTTGDRIIDLVLERIALLEVYR